LFSYCLRRGSDLVFFIAADFYLILQGGPAMRRTVIFFMMCVYLNGCTLNTSFNTKLENDENYKTKATFLIDEDRGNHQETLAILSLSGGGSRSAYWSASIMLALERVFDDINILEEIDVISSVSGGSLPAAYYVVSYSPDSAVEPPRFSRMWDEKSVKDLMSRNYRSKWFGNWFWPGNIIKYWFTAYDRSDIMAQTLADNMYDQRINGRDLKFRDINPKRPYIVLNSTNSTTGEFSNIFTFTHEDFKEILYSDINEYEIAKAVMATAAFPAVFNYMTLKDFRLQNEGKNRYQHVFDGGNADNLGLYSVERLLDANVKHYKRVIIILIDAYTESQGVPPEDNDGRKFFDYAVDLNFMDSVESLLTKNRDRIKEQFVANLELYQNKYIVFYHIEFNDVPSEELKERLNRIRTDFKIDQKDAEAIEEAAKLLIVRENICLGKIRNMLLEKEPEETDSYCEWSAPLFPN
jgi:predicted acylesterase/phospholipase RssA